MKKAPKIKNENLRIKKLQEYNILDTPASAEYDHFTKLAAEICHCPIALISLVDTDRQWFKSKYGIDAPETPRDVSYCGHAIEHDEIFIVEDSAKDERFADNPLFLNPPHVNFYAGSPLITPEGYKIGTLCVIDQNSKKLTNSQIESLKHLSNIIIELFEVRLKNKELQALKNQYEDVQSMSKTGGWELDLKTNQTSWSREVYDIHKVAYGAPTEKVNGISFYAPHERERLITRLDQCTSKKKAYDDIFEFYDREGGKKWVRVKGRPVLEEDGSIKKIIGTFQDITESKQKEERIVKLLKEQEVINQLLTLDNSENLPLQQKLEEALDLIIKTEWLNLSPSARVFLFNKKCELQVELELNKSKAINMPQTIDSINRIENLLKTNKYGSFFEYQDHCLTAPLLDDQAVAAGAVTMFFTDSNVDNRAEIKFLKSCFGIIGKLIASHHAKELLANSRKRLELALEGGGLGVWDWNLVDDTVQFDSRWAEMLGHHIEDLEMNINTWKDRVHPEDLAECYQDIEDYMNGKTDCYQNIHRTKHADGHWLYILGKGRISEWDKHGKPVRFTGTNSDVTEKIELEKAMQRNAKLASIGQLAAGVGHEINNPLAIIKGYVAAILKKHRPESEKAVSALEKIDAASDRISKIVSGLRTFARVEKSNQNNVFNLQSLLFEIENMIKEIYKQEGVTLEFKNSELPENLCLKGDRGKFEQVLINLIANAKDATIGQDIRSVRLTVEMMGQSLVIKVIDNGPGVPEDLKDKVFDPFFTTKDVGSGTGIGLSLVHKFIKHEFLGDVNIDDTNTEGGACFTIKVPTVISQQETLVLKKTKLSGTSHFNLTCLLVDDEEEIRFLLSQILQNLGIKVKIYENGKRALAAYLTEPKSIDLVISDMKMPVMDGMTLLKEIRRRKALAQPKFFFTTGGINVDFENKDDKINKLIDGHIYKPFTEDDIRTQLEQAFPKNKKKAA